MRGWVSVTGDAAPALPEVLAQIPAKCTDAREMYARAFREGMMRSLADVLVAVTGYEGRVTAKSDSVPVGAKGCAWSSRTLAVTLGQTLKIVTKDPEPYVPLLVGAETGAQLIVIPGGEPVPLKPPKLGRYDLADSLNLFMHADVFTLFYPTHAVTGLDGRYEISGIPPGEVSVSAVLPVTMASAAKKVVVEADKTVEVNLEIAFDAKVYAELRAAEAQRAAKRKAAAPSASAR